MKKLTKKDIININNAFDRKLDEYSKLTLDELKEIYPKLKGTYRLACIEVTKIKLLEERNKKIEQLNVENNEL